MWPAPVGILGFRGRPSIAGNTGMTPTEPPACGNRARQALLSLSASRHRPGPIHEDLPLPIRLTFDTGSRWLLSRLGIGWRDAVQIATPETVVRWHRQGSALAVAPDAGRLRRARLPVRPGTHGKGDRRPQQQAEVAVEYPPFRTRQSRLTQRAIFPILIPPWATGASPPSSW
jgi:hypothetical protein